MRTKNIQFADLTLTFNRPVSNPVLHFENMGGWWSTTNNGVTGYSAWFRLLTAGFTVSRLSGNTPFVVANGTDVKNSVAASSTGLINTNNNIAQGSVLVNGTGITTLTFRIFLDGDNNNGSNWSTTSTVQSDALAISVSLAAFSVVGTVFNDANGLSDNTINGSGTNAGGLNAVLVDPSTGNVVATIPVNADGTYSFTNSVLAGNYSLLITTETATVGSAAPAVVLPDGWAPAGENLGNSAGSDGTPDGILTGLNVTGNTSNANFAIQRPPATNDVQQTIAKPTGGSIAQGTVTTAVNGSDPEDGSLGNGNTVVITELPTNGTLLYNGAAVTTGQQINNFDPALLSFTDLKAGTTSTSFKYSFVDAAGSQSATPGTFTINWDEALPVTFGAITATLSNGQLMVNWNTLTETGNDHFEVELSKDGIHFLTIGTVTSKATNGNSDSELSYSFSADANSSAAALAGIGLLGVALITFLGSKRKNAALFFVTAITGCSLFILSCTKEKPNTNAADKLFVRIIQVDKNKEKQTSKVVQVVRK